MKIHLAAFLALSLFMGSSAAATSTALDLAGKWQGAVQFGKFKFNLVLRVTKTDAGRLAVTMDLPEQGQKEMPISALLFNYPDVRLEIDQFGTAYNGKLNEDGTVIEGGFEEGPGGRPISLAFKRSTEPDAPEPEKVFTFAPGEAQDIRGYWKGALEAGPQFKLAAGLNIGRVSDGTFRVTLDLPEQGAEGVPAKILESTNNSVSLEWPGFNVRFLAKLSDDQQELEGPWIQNGRTNETQFKRIDAPLKLLANNLTYEPDQSDPQDVRGNWKGTLEVPGGKLRLEFKIGRTPEGTYGGTLSSIDQGGKELPMSSASFTAPKLLMEWNGIRGKFEGTITNEGKMIEGKWEQFGNPVPLSLERAAPGDKKS
ncbi:MAG TPA: hypothetical protein VK633_03255 [Verrucomicrobiae bacterium]|nr:hypothetical protein [Verrucomicrobiae bacterium]